MSGLPSGVFEYYEVYENSDKTEGRGSNTLVCRTRERAHAFRRAKRLGPMGTDESVRTSYGIEIDGQVYSLGPCKPQPINMPTRDEDLEIEHALTKLTERERKLLKL